MKKILISLITIMISLSGCTIFQISQESLVLQLEENQDISISQHYTPFTVTEYPSNNLTRINCIDKNNVEVWVYPDKNTQFIITTKSENKSFRIYYDTLILKNDTLYGLRSRIMKAPKIFPLNDVTKIEVYTEFPKTERVIN